jgi:signal transduction histidine kinase
VTRRTRTSIAYILAISLALVTLVPFLPLAVLTWRAYQAEVVLLEQEIRATNRQTALLAAGSLESIVQQVRDDILIAVTGRVHWSSDPLPPPVAGVCWEALDRDGVVIASEITAGRVGRPAGYLDASRRTIGGTRPEFSPVGRHIPGSPATCVLVEQVDPDRILAAVIDPEALRRRLAAIAPGLDRHVYAADRSGRLLFYSDPKITQRGEDLSANPPVALFAGGGAGEIRFRSIVSGKERLGYVQPVGGTDWGVIVSADIASSVLAVRDRYLTLALSIVFALAAALGILMWSSRRLTRPLAEIRQALQRERAAHAGPLRLEMPEPNIAEYRDLVDTLNDLSRRLAATEAELVQAAKASVTGQLASGIAHEIGTPLNVISGSAQLALRKLAEDDPCRQTLQMVVRQTERISSMVQRFLEFSRTPGASLGPVDVADVARQVIELIPEINRKVDARLRFDPATPMALGDPKLLEHALMNLILNACQAMPDGGTLTIEVEPAEPARAEDGRREPWVRCRVSDTGCGIAPEHLGRVFEPFFTTKAIGQGTGLGLAIVDRIVRQHGGRIEAASSPGRGAVFTLWLRAAGSPDPPDGNG